MVDVTGGTHGIAADLEMLRGVAGTFGHAGADTLASALHLHAYLIDPDIALAAVFDPVGVAGFETALGTALDGPLGLSWSGARCEAADVLTRAAAGAYAKADDLYTEAKDKAVGAVELPPALAYLVYELGRTRNPSLALQRTLTRFPDTADVLTPLTLDLVLTRLGLPPDPELAAHLIPDGHGVAVARGVDRGGADARPPRDLADLIAGLSRRNDAADTDHGEIDIRFLTRPDGSRAVIVDITGTKSWSPGRTHDITSLATNGRALYGEHTSYEQGVLAAMRRAGVTRRDTVMIVGHSEGGMVAITTARDAVDRGEFNVTHVITAGSPIGRSVGSVPRSVKVLALENSRDLVPHLDGRGNPDRVNVTTVSGGHGNGTVTDDHSLTDGYGPLARDTERSHNGSIQDYLRSCSGYFDAHTSTTTRFQIVRRF